MKKLVILLIIGASMLTAQNTAPRIVTYEEIALIGENIKNLQIPTDKNLRDLAKYLPFFLSTPDENTLLPNAELIHTFSEVKWVASGQSKEIYYKRFFPAGAFDLARVSILFKIANLVTLSARNEEAAPVQMNFADFKNSIAITNDTTGPHNTKSLAPSAGFNLPAMKLAQATADVLVDRAERTLQQWFLNQFGEQLDKHGDLFGNTTRILTQPGFAPLSSLSLVATALRQDFIGLPSLVLATALSDKKIKKSDKSLLALYTSRAFARLLQGAPSIEAFQQMITANEMEIIFSEGKGNWITGKEFNELPETIAEYGVNNQNDASIILRTSLLLRMMELEDGALTTDVKPEVMIRTILANSEAYHWNERGIWPKDELLSSAEIANMLQRIESLFTKIKGITPPIDSVSIIQFSTAIADTLEKYFLEMVPAANGETVMAKKILTDSRKFLEVIQTGNYQVAIMQLLANLDEIGVKNISPNTARVLTFAAALAQANDEQSARAALDAFAVWVPISANESGATGIFTSMGMLGGQ